MEEPSTLTATWEDKPHIYALSLLFKHTQPREPGHSVCSYPADHLLHTSALRALPERNPPTLLQTVPSALHVRPSGLFHGPSQDLEGTRFCPVAQTSSPLARLPREERKEDSEPEQPTAHQVSHLSKISGQKLPHMEVPEAYPNRDWPEETKWCSWWGRGKQFALQQHPRGVK